MRSGGASSVVVPKWCSTVRPPASPDVSAVGSSAVGSSAPSSPPQAVRPTRPVRAARRARATVRGAVRRAAPFERTEDLLHELAHMFRDVARGLVGAKHRGRRFHQPTDRVFGKALIQRPLLDERDRRIREQLRLSDVIEVLENRGDHRRVDPLQHVERKLVAQSVHDRRSFARTHTLYVGREQVRVDRCQLEGVLWAFRRRCVHRSTPLDAPALGR